MTKYFILPLAIITLLTGCNTFQKPASIETQPITTSNTNIPNNLSKPVMTNTATIKTTKGDIVVELYGTEAPKTIAYFTKLANEKFYEGIYFHRVIADFMIQTGDPQAKGTEGVDFVYDASNNPKKLPIAGTGGPGYAFEDEFNPNLRFDKPGVLAMANSGPNSNGSQFFITHVPYPSLNDKHTIFGQVTSGQDVVNSIERGDKILSITVN